MADRTQSTVEPLAVWIEQANKKGTTTVALSQKRASWLVPQKIDKNPRIHSQLDDIETWRLNATSYSEVRRPIIEAPRIHIEGGPKSERFGFARKYEGYISQRVGETFWAMLRENPGDFPPIEAEFDVTDLPESDRSIAVEGMPLVWTLGVQIEDGTHKRQSILYLRRITPPSSVELRASEVGVEDRMRAIPWD